MKYIAWGRLPLILSACCLLFSIALAAEAHGDDGDDPARRILAESAIHGGLVVHVGCGDGKLTAALKQSDAYIVHWLDTDPAEVRKARERFLAKKVSGTVSAATFDGMHLPYIDNMVNLLVLDSAFDVPKAELMRVLAPRGVLLEKSGDGWRKTVKPVPKELDEWSHYLREPDNNAVSKDTAITGPIRHLQWKGSPKYSRHHDKASSVPAVVTVGGRVFYLVDEGPRASILWDSDWKVVARDAFNGVILWKKQIEQWTDQLWPLKSGPSKSPRRLVATADAVYVTLGLLAPVSKLDAVTGEELEVYEGTEKTEEIILADGVLYLVIHPTIDPARRGGSWDQNPKKIMAVKQSDGSVLWRQELPWIAPSTLTVGEENVYVCDGPRIIAFDKTSGKQSWKSKELPWREKMPTYFAPTLVAAEGCVLYAGGENWHEHAGSRGKLTCLDAKTGKIKWQQPHLPSGYQSPQDIFVIGDLVWCGSLNSKPGEFDKRYPDVSPSTGEFIAYNLNTGELEKTIPRGADCYWFHHRCHRAKATENFFLTSRTGIEMIDIESGKWHLHHWTRGACAYGIMPANGLIYGPPHPCACYPEAKLSGFNALAGASQSRAALPISGDRLEMGPAYNLEIDMFEKSVPKPGWTTFRGNIARSGSTDAAVGEDVDVKWKTQIGGKLSQPVVSGTILFVAAVDDHTLYALEKKTGKVIWKYIVGGRIDSPPTIYKGTAIFGCADGSVYCLSASNGELVWRFRAAPCDRRLMSYEQLESVWPVHGNVLVRDEVAYVVAGRSMFLDGGLTLYRLHPASGEVLSQAKMDANDPNTGEDLHKHVTWLDMPVASSDILSSEGDLIFMRSQPFDLDGKRERVAHAKIHEQQGDEAHLFVPNGFLDDNYWHRAFWVFGRSVHGGPGYARTGHHAPSGKIMVLDEDNAYIFGRQQQYWRWTTPTEYRLFAVDRKLPPPTGNPRRKRNAAFGVLWDVDLPILARSMVKADNTIFACGPADVVNEPDVQLRNPEDLAPLRKQAAIYAGSEGSLLCMVSAKDGAKIADKKLDVLPVFDGLIAADGKLFMSTVGGEVVCLGK